MSASALHSCNLCTCLQSPFTVAILLHDHNHHACCNPCAWLQSLCLAAVTMHSCSAHAQLQSWCMAVLRWPWAGARGLITGPWLPVLRTAPCYLTKQPSTTLPLPWAAGWPRNGCARAWAGSGQQWCDTWLVSIYSSKLLSPPPLLTCPGSHCASDSPPGTDHRISPAFSCWWVPLQTCPPNTSEDTAPSAPLLLSTAHGGNQCKGFCGKWGDRRLTTELLYNPSDVSDCPHTIKCNLPK